jgi:hypothetical protein
VDPVQLETRNGYQCGWEGLPLAWGRGSVDVGGPWGWEPRGAELRWGDLDNRWVPPTI